MRLSNEVDIQGAFLLVEQRGVGLSVFKAALRKEAASHKNDTHSASNDDA